ncbi:siderophore-interacting protein [Streptomyces sp. J2-1]|uniref:siderophore-interacting protein n=1 Tax=Streptomyces corallincola TaxID=2851888 RepID=UPI001C385EE3|nr:siderophore-interacting protein [Streptomyces corallincola]MBV2355843.1 siderophore-interacting protein [Streptomyces corallincola]
MAERPGRKPRKPHTAHVIRTERLTPHVQRVVLGGDGLAEFAADTCTDHYVKLLFGPEGVSYPEPFDMDRIRAEFPREQWPVTRTYTVRAWDPVHREMTVDFVLHGDQGLAGPWALNARPGDTLRFLGPGGAYAPDPAADWHLLAGDESALPAIARALETLPAGARVHAFVEVAGPEEEQKIDSRVDVVWLHRGTRPVGEALLDAVHALRFPEGRMHAFVHGEAHFVKQLRRLLRVDLAVPREDLSISGYWRVGHNEDGWQASKREWNARIEEEQERREAERAGGVAAA